MSARPHEPDKELEPLSKIQTKSSDYGSIDQLVSLGLPVSRNIFQGYLGESSVLTRIVKIR